MKATGLTPIERLLKETIVKLVIYANMYCL